MRLDFLPGTRLSTRVLMGGRQIGSSVVGNVVREAEVGAMGGGHKPRNASSLPKLKEARKGFFPQKLQKDPALLTSGF